MSDLIDRKAAIDAVNAYMGLSAVSRTIQNMTSVQEILERLPSAEPEIVRCKECRHNRNCEIQYHAQAGDLFYCGAAERRTDETDYRKE